MDLPKFVARRLVDSANRGEGFHGLTNIGVNARRHAAKNGRAEEDWLFGRNCDDRLAAGIREDLAHQRARPRTTTDHHLLNASPGLRLGFDDLAQPVANAAEAGDVKRNEIIEVALHPEPRNYGSGMRIGEGRSIAEEFRDNIYAGSELHRLRRNSSS
ncbi:hypothetical protein RHI9324_04812 [Rhizobium sp. CECT 9324]|nr:hypothetical protein RHI9324_04812 [Rhizobium sp. CECT 9324]